jgi:hypothetical protein
MLHHWATSYQPPMNLLLDFFTEKNSNGPLLIGDREDDEDDEPVPDYLTLTDEQRLFYNTFVNHYDPTHPGVSGKQSSRP